MQISWVNCVLSCIMKNRKNVSSFSNNNRHKYGDLVLGPTFFFKREVSENVKMRDLSKSEKTRTSLKDSLKAGFKIYATDPYNFVYMRKKVEGFHTWDATDEQLLRMLNPLDQRIQRITHLFRWKIVSLFNRRR